MFIYSETFHVVVYIPSDAIGPLTLSLCVGSIPGFDHDDY
jgi:hypothetical protein